MEDLSGFIVPAKDTFETYVPISREDIIKKRQERRRIERNTAMLHTRRILGAYIRERVARPLKISTINLPDVVINTIEAKLKAGNHTVQYKMIEGIDDDGNPVMLRDNFMYINWVEDPEE